MQALNDLPKISRRSATNCRFIVSMQAINDLPKISRRSATNCPFIVSMQAINDLPKISRRSATKTGCELCKLECALKGSDDKLKVLQKTGL